VVIEDAIAGVQAARNAGMACIAVLTTNPAEALAQADLIVDRLDHLPPEAIWRLVPRL
jgi:beta-phosphoglucomutase-like phosphatase (HAD superfamily)